MPLDPPSTAEEYLNIMKGYLCGWEYKHLGLMKNQFLAASEIKEMALFGFYISKKILGEHAPRPPSTAEDFKLTIHYFLPRKRCPCLATNSDKQNIIKGYLCGREYKHFGLMKPVSSSLWNAGNGSIRLLDFSISSWGSMPPDPPSTHRVRKSDKCSLKLDPPCEKILGPPLESMHIYNESSRQ